MIEPRTCLLLAHLAGLVLGLGAAVLLDLHLLRLLRGHVVTAFEVTLVRHGERLVGLGLALLWVSGCGLVAVAAAADPVALSNPKLHAKIAVVLLLTLNGFALHARVLPLFARNVGRSMFAGLTPAYTASCLAHGAVSASAWGFAFVLGAVRELNFAADFWRFGLAYVALLGLASVAMLLVYRPAEELADRAAA